MWPRNSVDLLAVFLPISFSTALVYKVKNQCEKRGKY
jgi:hypothetical protein